MIKVNRLRHNGSGNLPSRALILWATSLAVFVVGGLALLNWWFNWDFLPKWFFLSRVTIKANVALGFILSGLSLWLSSIGSDKVQASTHPFVRTSILLVAQGCALSVTAIGALTLGEYLFGWDLGIDNLLLPNGSVSPNTGRMGLNTALALMLAGRALELLAQPKTQRSYWYAQILALLAGVIASLALMGYTYQVPELISIFPQTPFMAVHTAVTLIVLCVGILWSQIDQGVMQVIISDSYSSILTRRLLLVEVIVPLVLGWLILQGQRARIYESAFAISLLVVVLIISSCVLIWQNGALVEKLSQERDRVKQELKVNEEKLRSFVDANLIGISFGDIHGGIQQANDEFLQMIGYTREDFQASQVRWIDITPPEYLPLDEQGIAEAKVSGACTPYEKEYICKNGNRVPVLVGYVLVGEDREETVAFSLDLSKHKQAEAALRQSEERFRLAVDNIPDVFSIYDAQRRFQFVNTVALQYIKKPKEEILGHTDEELFPPEVTAPYLPTLIEAQETRTIKIVEATLTLPEYGTITSIIKYVPILNEKGEIYQILGVTDDITVRKQAEEALRNQQQWLEAVLNLMPTPLLFIEPGTARVIFANRAADEVAGGQYPKDQADSQTFYYSNDSAGAPIPQEQAPEMRVARGERLEAVELDWHTPIGVRSLLIFADTLPAMHGYPATCVLIFQDISELKRTQKALALGYNRLQLLFYTASHLLSSQQPTALLDTVFSKLAEQIGLDIYINYLVDETSSGLQLASYIGLDQEQMQQIERRDFGQEVCGTVALERRPIAIENLQQSIDPKVQFLRSVGLTAFCSYPLIAQNRFLGTLAFGSRRRLRFSQNELGMMQAVCDQIAIAMEHTHLIASLHQQTAQLREANRLKDEFLAILSHELRSPLNAILGWTQLLRSSRRPLDEAKKAQALETIERNAKVQTQLIEDLLDVSRMIRGKLQLYVRTCNLVSIIETAIETVRLAAEAKEIDLQFSIQSHLPQNQKPHFLISGDAERLQQIVWNLLSNAIKFTPPRGRVEVILERVEEEGKSSQSSAPPSLHTHGYTRIIVRDTGIGISADFLPYVFDRFRQADSSNTRIHGGLGLGLAIVRYLVELHGGTVHAHSLGEGQGATFVVNLPLMKRHDKDNDETLLHQDLVPSLSFSSRGCCPLPRLSHVRVLVVEDQADIRELCITLLTECQAEVKAVGSAQAALDVMEEWQPDVLVSDINLPEEDGYFLIRKVRSREQALDNSLPPDQRGKRLPAAALIAYARAEDRMRAVQEGYQLYLPKPVEPAELMTVVASLAGRV